MAVLQNNRDEYFSGSKTYFYYNVIAICQFLALKKGDIK